MSTKKVQKESKFIRYMKGPAKILARARDFYVRSLTSCAGNLSYGSTAVGGPNLQFASLPRSFSVNSSQSDYRSRDEDLRELISFASSRSLRGKIEAEVLHRSRTVAIGRIDEEKPYEHRDDVVGEVYCRSKSYATPKRNS